MGVFDKLRRLITTGAGEPLPGDVFVKLDANDVTLATAIDANTASIAALQRAGQPAGVTFGTVDRAFVYPTLATPAGAPSKGLVSIAGLGPDQGGRSVSVRLTATRRAIVSWDVASTGNGPRVTFVDVSGAAPAVLASAAVSAVNDQRGYTLNNYLLLGAYRATDNVVRLLGAYSNSSTGSSWLFVVTATLDPSSNAITSSLDVSINTGNPTQQFLDTGTVRRSWQAGQFGVVTPAIYYAVSAHLGVQACHVRTERTAGSAFCDVTMTGGALSTAALAEDLWGANAILRLSDGRGTGSAGSTATLSLHSADDLDARSAVTIRLGVAVAGAPRVCCISPTLAVVGFTTGSQYATYLVQRGVDGNGNPTLTIVGGSVSTGPLGSAPIQILPWRGTGFAVFVRGAGRAVVATIFSVNAAAAAGANPFAQVGTFTLTVGANVANSAAGDGMFVMDMDFGETPDVIELVGRNTSQAVNFFERFALPTT